MARDIVSSDKRRIQDADGDLQDFSKKGYTYVEEGHHKDIIEGLAFYAENYDSSVDAAGAINLAIVNSSTYCAHVHLSYISDDAITTQFTEGPDITGGSTVDALCINMQQSDNTYFAEVLSDVTISTVGAELENSLAGAAEWDVPGKTTGTNWILKAGETYVAEVTNVSDDASKILISCVFHERTVADMS